MESEKEIRDYLIQKLGLEYDVDLSNNLFFKIGHMLDENFYFLRCFLHSNDLYYLELKAVTGMDGYIDEYGMACEKITTKKDVDLAIIKIKIEMQELINDQANKINNILKFIKNE